MDLSASIIIIGGIILIILLIVGVIVSSNSERSIVEERLSQYIDEGDGKDVDREAQKYVLTNWVSKRVEKTSFGGKIARDLARADMKFKAAEYLALIVLSTLLSGLIFFFLGNRHWISGVIGLGIGAVAPRFYMKSQQRKRLQKFNDQLPDMLNLMVNGLRAGYSTMQALEAISKELPPPINDEFRRVVQEMQIGIPMETALDNLLRRIPSDDLDFVITAINVQREVGGNLAEVLQTVADTMRARNRLKGDVRALTAEGRISAVVVGLLPILMGAFLWLTNPDYLEPLLTRTAGIVALGVGLLLMIAGAFWLKKIVTIEV